MKPPHRYVLGFLFSPDLNSVLLLRKARPDWQAGKLNGVGGKIESTDRSALAAMQREWSEEMKSAAPGDVNWQHFASMNGPDWLVEVYAATGDLQRAESASPNEPALIMPVEGVWGRRSELVENTEWLIALAVQVGHHGQPGWTQAFFS